MAGTSPAMTVRGLGDEFATRHSLFAIRLANEMKEKFVIAPSLTSSS